MASALDQQLFLFFNVDRGIPWLDTLMAVFSSLDFWMPFLVLAAALVAWRGGFRGRAMIVCLLLSIGLMEGAFVNPLKKLFGRPRPDSVLSEARSISLADTSPRFLAVAHPAVVKPARVTFPIKPGKSFPSGHTANMFCFATVLAAFYGRRGAWFFLVAATVAVSRVATGSHWPSDVVLTAVLSVIVTSVLLALYGWIWRMFAPRVAPTLAASHPALIPRA